MGNYCCCCKASILDTEATKLRQLTGTQVSSPNQRQVNGSLQNRTIPLPQEIRKTNSAPTNPQLTNGSINSPLSPLLSARSLSDSSLATSSRPSAATSRPRADYPIRTLTSTVRRLLPEDFKFRILVVGERGSGKSSLIKSVFKVGVTAVAGLGLGGTDIEFGYGPEDNRYLIVHECSRLGSWTEDSQRIREFISRRTDTTLSAPERLHAVWICVPASDAFAGELGEGVEEILGMRTASVPVILVLTKFDRVVSEAFFDIPRDDPQRHERAKANALTMYEEYCRRRFDKDPRDVPAEVVSEKPRDADLIGRLVATTDSFILGSRGPSTRFGVQEERTRVSDVPLAWSAAVRVGHDIVVEASIAVGRSGHWHRLRTNVDFADHRLMRCVNIIHLDLVDIWNLNDRTMYLSGNEFKIKMSHLVKDLAGPAGTMPDPYPTAGIEFADWVRHTYRGSTRDVRCVVAYIVNLTVILDAIFSTTSGDISREVVLSAIENHVDSGNRDKIHYDIRSFVTQAFKIGFSVSQKDLILGKIIDLIRQFCVPPAVNS